MSGQPQFPSHTFTSTLTDHRGKLPHFNYFIVIMTALFFFTVLAWFNFALALYSTITTSDRDHEDTTLINLGFAVIWTLIVVLIYVFMDYVGVLNGNVSEEDHVLRSEGRLSADTGRDVFGQGTTDYAGEINIGAI